MSKNSKAKRDKKKKAEKKGSSASGQIKPMSMAAIQAGLDNLFNPNKLTYPKSINDDLVKFCKNIRDEPSFFIDITPEPWSRQSCCDSNVEEYIRLNGGEIVCGYKIWYHEPIYIEAERHAVWHKDGEYRDISFNADGEDKILFVPDKPEMRATLESNNGRIRWGKNTKTRTLIEYQERIENHRSVYKMSKEKAWNTMLTYEQWKEGQRMPSLISTILN